MKNILTVFSSFILVIACGGERPNTKLDFAKSGNSLTPDCSMPVPKGHYDQSQFNQALIPALKAIDVTTLHSNPNAGYTLYLDFNGHHLSGTSWNNLLAKGDPIDFPSMLDANDPYGAAMIFAIWQETSQYFSPFNINVTTEDPPLEAFGGFPGTAKTALRALITEQHPGYQPVGGIAYLHSASYNSDTPVLIFYRHRYSSSDTALIVTHETGHAFGLSHDGLDASAYHQGTPEWGPIMGAPYISQIKQWSKGEYEGHTNTEDDFAILKAKLSVVDDDHSDTQDHATPITILDDTTFAIASGLIGNQEDADLFEFDAGKSHFRLKLIQADPGGRIMINSKGGSLYARADILDENMIHVSDVAFGLNTTSAWIYVPTPGKYYLHITPMFLEAASSDYGSLGKYLVFGSY
jgi:serralysin